ncbi:MAG: hypothetical protein C7B45_03640 [Sulfobacillus acidophilus]|uniref:Probable inorganic carbon transporter subunit DabB n=1 Tax=Sulfobacillus acidophilus TaxID=53633 RepID=A0A2T2WLU3_9FIRM|nr:MAG: hypothetical protein C7B45_03640 [Sulfobacillus acidophilus]
MMIVPLPLLGVGLLLGIGADRHARLTKGLSLKAAWFALSGAVLAATASWGMSASHTFLAIPLPKGLGTLALSVDVNRLTVLMLGLVALIGMITVLFSSTYLRGELHEGQFHRWLSLALGSLLMLIVSDNMWAFLIFWIVTSLGLHRLLAVCHERPTTLLAARKTFWVHRTADVSLMAALVLITRSLHTSQFASVGPALGRLHGSLPAPLQIACGLLLLSAMLKSAPFPFHGWIGQVMEAPTPVSAVLHAGIIYVGAFLLLRMVSLMLRVAWAGDLLIVVGLTSIITASLMMMTATTIKGSLTYSTSAQMGFMLMECGLGLYSLALLHIVAHAVYKAHAFLASGSVVDHFRVPVVPTAPYTATLRKAIPSLLMALGIVIATAIVFAVPLLHQPQLIVMGFILTVAISRLLGHAFTLKQTGARSLGKMIILSAVISVAYFGLARAFATLFGTILPTSQGSAGVVYDGLLGLIIVAFAGLWLVQPLLPRILRHPVGQALYVHLYNDLYIDRVLTRLVRTARPASAANPPQAAQREQRWKAMS